VSSDRSAPVLLAIERIGVQLDGRTVLDDVSLCARDGETVALVGPSGSGKTTLLRVVAGLQTPSTGTVRVAGRDLSGVAPHERGIGLMFQDFALFPHRNVAGNVEFGLRMRKRPAAERRARVAEVLRLVGLCGFERRSVSSLSGGERQRVALARSLAPEPRLLMLDEPLGSLDRTMREQLVLELRELFEELGITVVYVTHDQAEALALADTVTVLNEGRVEQTAAPETLWSEPASPFVARFLGFTNLLPVDVAGGVVETTFGAIARDVEWPDGDAIALVRPSAIAIRDASASSMTGRVQSTAFAGDRTTAVISMGGGPALEVTVPGSATVPSIGEEVGVVFDSRGIQLFGASGDASNGRPGAPGPE
jgi:thiamine transport system ATP-binding protein